jgi:hypothetical protein
METIIALECPKCHHSVKPQADWFQCGYCGAFLKLVETENGDQFIDSGVISGDRVHRVSRDIVHVIETESQLIRDTLVQQQAETSDGNAKLAKVNYLLYLSQKKESLERRISELEKVSGDVSATEQLEKFKHELADVLISIEDHECQIDPGRAGRKAREAKQKELAVLKAAQEKKEKEHGLVMAVIVICAIVVIVTVIALAAR